MFLLISGIAKIKAGLKNEVGFVIKLFNIRNLCSEFRNIELNSGSHGRCYSA